MNDNRGVIKHIARAQQINSFKNIRYGNITPTDLDGAIEYHDKCWVFFELKYNNAPISYGQKLALERLVNDTAKNNKKSIAIIADHYVNDTNKEVDAADCVVREIYLSNEKKWRGVVRKMSLKECVDAFIDWVDKKQESVKAGKR